MGKSLHTRGEPGVEAIARAVSVREAVTASGGLFLLFAMFLDWFQEQPTCYLAALHRISGWNALGAVSVVLAVTALVPFAHVVVRYVARTGLPPAALPLAGVASLSLILIEAATTVGTESRWCSSVGARTIQTSAQAGLWIGIVLPVVMTFAGALVWRSQSPIEGHQTDTSARARGPRP